MKLLNSLLALGLMAMSVVAQSDTPTKSAGCGKAPTLTSGTKTISVNGKQRTYILRVPNNYDRTRAYKLIFGFHWYGGTAVDVATGQTVTRDVWSYYGLQRLANESAIFVAPQGINNGWGNAGGEDLAFTDAMIKAIEADLCVNQKQRFSTGFSYGAMWSYTLACQRASVFRAVAALDGAGGACNGGQIGYLGVHGVSDNIAGGRTMRDNFVSVNKCTKPATNPPEPAVGSRTHTVYKYQGCATDKPVWWLAFDGGHIAAPYDGGSGDNGNKAFTPPLTWEFFNSFN